MWTCGCFGSWRQIRIRPVYYPFKIRGRSVDVVGTGGSKHERTKPLTRARTKRVERGHARWQVDAAETAWIGAPQHLSLPQTVRGRMPNGAPPPLNYPLRNSSLTYAGGPTGRCYSTPVISSSICGGNAHWCTARCGACQRMVISSNRSQVNASLTRCPVVGRRKVRPPP